MTQGGDQGDPWCDQVNTSFFLLSTIITFGVIGISLFSGAYDDVTDSAELSRDELYTIGLPGKSILGGHFLGLSFRVDLPDLVTSANFGSSRVGPSGPRARPVPLCLHAT